MRRGWVLEALLVYFIFVNVISATDLGAVLEAGARLDVGGVLHDVLTRFDDVVREILLLLQVLVQLIHRDHLEFGEASGLHLLAVEKGELLAVDTVLESSLLLGGRHYLLDLLEFSLLQVKVEPLHFLLLLGLLLYGNAYALLAAAVEVLAFLRNDVLRLVFNFHQV